MHLATNLFVTLLISEPVTALAKPELPPFDVERGEFNRHVPDELQFGCVGSGSKHADSLIALLEKGTPGQQLSAARALWKGHNRQCADKVIKFAVGPSPGGTAFRDFQRKVNDSLAPKSILKELVSGDYLWGTWLAFLRPDKSLVPVLLAGLKDKKDARHETALALGNTGDPRVREPLIALLKKKDYSDSGAAAQALGYFGDPATEPALIEALGESSAWFQAEVCGALGRIGTKKALPGLFKITETKGYTGAIDSRGAAMHAIVLIENRLRKSDLASTTSELKPMLVLRGHESYVWAIAFDPTGKKLASTGNDDTVRVWDLEASRAKFIVEGHARQMMHVAFVDESGRLATSGWGEDGSIRLVDLLNGKAALSIPAGDGGVRSMVVSNDGKYIASSGSDNKSGVHLWDPASGKAVYRFEKAGCALVFSPDNKLVVTDRIEEDREDIVVWDVLERKMMISLPGHVESPRCAAFSPDGKTLATAGDWTVKVWDLKTGKAKFTARGNSRISSLSYSADGKLLAAGEYDRVFVIDAADGRTLHVLNAREPAAFSPKKNVLATGARDSSNLLLWDLEGTSGRK